MLTSSVLTSRTGSTGAADLLAGAGEVSMTGEDDLVAVGGVVAVAPVISEF